MLRSIHDALPVAQNRAADIRGVDSLRRLRSSAFPAGMGRERKRIMGNSLK